MPNRPIPDDFGLYTGPEYSLNRFLAGEIVTREQFITDQSLWINRQLQPGQRRRLLWMIEHA